MSISLQTDAGGEGTGGTIDTGTVQVNLIQIITLNGTVNDTGFGQGATTGDLIPATYVQPATNTGAPATRINHLINTDFKVSSGNPDIIIVGAGPNFTLLDGTSVCGNGFTIHPNSTDNPTGSIYVIYDTSNGNGQGIQVPALSGSGTVPTPDPVVLYHELSHAFRLANTFLGALPVPATDDEVLAIDDENVLRPLLGIGQRDPNPPHTGSAPGCPGPPGNNCCIVATVATGSGYSAEVSVLRSFRDRVLRNSEIGFNFFEHLHEDYYAFSPQVCTLMAQSPALHDRIRLYFVGPLVRVLELLQRYTSDRIDETVLGDEFAQGVAESELASLRAQDIDRALALLSHVRNAELDLGGALPEFAGILEESARRSPFIRWALLDPVEIYARGLRWRVAGMSAPEIGTRLAREFDDWSARFPVTNRWESLSNYALASELAFLNRILFRGPAARLAVGRQLVERIGADADRFATLKAAGFVSEEG